MIDTSDLLRQVKLEQLVAQDVAVLHRVGKELHGSCPFCVCSTTRRHRCDRFRLNADRDRWFCRQCSESGGDAISYLMKRDNLDFLEACRELGADERRQQDAVPRPAPASTVTPEPAPSAIWQAAAERFVADCQADLWLSAGAQRAVDWLHARGLTDATLGDWRIGYCADDHYGTASDWDTERRQWLPRGIVIPWVQDGVIWAIKVRLPVKPSARHYHCVAGSRMDIVYGNQTIQSHKPLVLLESELDVLLLDQEAGDLVAAGSLNGTRTDFTRRMLLVLRKAHPIYVGYDNDPPGREAAHKIVELGPRFRPVCWPDTVKDLADLAPAGHSVRTWIEQHLAERKARVDETGKTSESLLDDPVIARAVALFGGTPKYIPFVEREVEDVTVRLVCAACGQGESRELGSVVLVGDVWLHPDCRLVPASDMW